MKDKIFLWIAGASFLFIIGLFSSGGCGKKETSAECKTSFDCEPYEICDKGECKEVEESRDAGIDAGIDAGYPDGGDEVVEENVSISGAVSYPDYTQGTVWVRFFRNAELTDLMDALELNSPGPWEIVVAKNSGQLWVKAEIDINKNGRLELDEPVGLYSDNPIEVGEENITGIDITLAVPLHVTIYGEVIYDDYQSGSILIGAFTSLPPGEKIAGTLIEAPGEYSFALPENAGDIYVAAFNDLNEDEEPNEEEPYGEYAGNPFPVGVTDIHNVDITLAVSQ